MEKKPRKIARPLRFIERALLLGSLALLSWCAFLLAESHATQAYGNWSLGRMHYGRSVSRLDFVVDHVVPAAIQSWIGCDASTEALDSEAAKTPTMPAGALVGRIDIPRLHVRAIVLEGDADATLRRGVGHVAGTPFPGEPGNSALAGHRDTFFHPLLKIRRADRISFVTPEKTYRYSVDSVRIVSPDEVSVLAPSPSPILTLVTCYPFNYIGAAPSRFVVRAHQL